jgi:hypothetical protein
MFSKIEMTTLSEVMNKLKGIGFTDDFEIENDLLVGKGIDKKYHADELTIIKTYRFEGDSDPGDMSILYVIETNDGHKGTYVDAFGLYGDQGTHTAEFLKQIKSET